MNCPDVRMEINDDPMGGYNIRVTTTNFKFTPENVNTSNRMYEGTCTFAYQRRKKSGPDLWRILPPGCNASRNLRNIGHPE